MIYSSNSLLATNLPLFPSLWVVKTGFRVPSVIVLPTPAGKRDVPSARPAIVRLAT